MIHIYISIYKILSQQSEVAIEWLIINQMLANPNKIQAMIIQRNFRNPTETNKVHIRDTDITPEPVVNLLGVPLDIKLSFNDHISQLYCKASHLLNVHKRIWSIFEETYQIIDI